MRTACVVRQYERSCQRDRSRHTGGSARVCQHSARQRVIARMRLTVLFLLSVVSGALAPIDKTVPVQPAGVSEVLDLYEQGQHAQALAEFDRLGSIETAYKQFDRGAPSWITAANGTAQRRRALVAAVLALDVARPRATNEPAAFTRSRFILRGDALLRDARAEPLPAERLWYDASVAGLERLGAWQILIGTRMVSVLDPIPWNLWDLSDKRGYLSQALARYPDDPRLRLAEVEGQDVQTMAGGPRRWAPEDDVVTPALLAVLRARAASHGRPDVTSKAGALPQALATVALARLSAVSEIERSYREIARLDDVRAEATLRLGYLRLRTQDWEGGLENLRDVSRLTTDPFLLYLTDLFAGWAFEQSQRADDAMVAYEDALKMRPRAWSASRLLAVQLFLRDGPGDRDRASGLVQEAGLGPAPDDPWTLYRLGDARLWDAEMVELRETLK
jgi:tetratricopeptide (TPR) repeat protein